MPAPEVSFLVNAYDDPVKLIIKGRACFQNAQPVDEFFKKMIDSGCRHFVVDFLDCTGMDSTFLGILAGAGIRLMNPRERGRMVLTCLGPRNRELVENLGLDQIMEVASDADTCGEEAAGGVSSLPRGRSGSAKDHSRLVLRAHEDLVRVDQANESKFQDVIAFLKNQIEE